LIERSLPPRTELSQPPGLRVSALSRASENVLDRIGAWQPIRAARAAPFRRMAVWEQDDGPQTVFDAAELAETHLGHIVENNLIQEAALDAFRHSGGELLCPAAVSHFEHSGGLTRVQLDEGQSLHCRLLIAADGARSALRTMAGIDAPAHAYDQHALVATVSTALGQQDITWQRFKPTGPEAMLPLVGNTASLVWYHAPEQVAALKAMDEAAFLDALHATFPERLGEVTSVIERGSFPLFRAHAERYVLPGFALIGDAAHSVHPLAGQGVNLGLMDAAALVDVLVDARRAHRDLGSERVLRRYQRWRRGENAVMSEVLHSFQRGFGSTSPVLAGGRRLVLEAGARLQPARVAASRFAMGLAGDLPSMARPHSVPEHQI
ncbi:MAG: FAD-dependent monooxygenase, partial [Pseudomonadota bacterium]